MALPLPPRLTPAAPASPPLLPEKWHATALVTPFPAVGKPQAPFVADITYDWSVQAMLITSYSLEGASLDLLVVGAGTVYKLEGGLCYLQASGSNWSVPAPDWLAGRDLACQGIGDVLDVSCQWWSGTSECKNSLEHPDQPPPTCEGGTPCAGTWIWSRADNGFPWRMMFISQGNPYEFPVLGDHAMANLPTFEAVGDTKLPSILANCQADGRREASTNAGGADRDFHTGVRLAGAWPAHPVQAAITDLPAALRQQAAETTDAERAENLAKVQGLIPGLKPLPGICKPFSLPSWPATLYMTALTTPTFPGQHPPGGPWYNAPFPTQIYYDSSNPADPAQLSRFYQPDGTISDTLLLVPTSYGIDRDADGQVTDCEVMDPSIPPPNMHWPATDQSVCLAAIVNNPQLSPGRTTLIIGCPSDAGRCFYIWYTTDSTAVMFSEVPQCCDVSLTLIDYFDVIPQPSLPAGIFDIPPECKPS
jgi:hypothetical protein